jgi:predicted nucleic acid-binding protein
MSAERFTLDTNILAYSVDVDDQRRHAIAVEIMHKAAECDCWLTLQALSEFYSVVTRKGIARPRDAATLADDWLDIYPTVGATPTAVRAALATAASGKASYWDALLIATAEEAGCVAIVTEDLAAGARLGGVEICNPFGRDGLSKRARELLRLT